MARPARRTNTTKPPAGQPAGVPWSELVEVTPIMAQKWLDEKNTNNRLPRSAPLARYARDMEHEAWEVNGETIKFDVDGNLLDGQHRLQGVVATGKPITTFVVYGLPASVQRTVDSGANRTAADALRIHGHASPAALSAAAKWCLLYEQDMLGGTRLQRQLTNSDIGRYVEEHPALEECARVGSMKIDLPVGVKICAYYLCTRVDADAAAEFFGRLADGVNLPANSPILVCRNRLRDIKDTKTRTPGEALLSLVIRCWNAWRQGETMRRVQVFKPGPVGRQEPVPCPQPL